MKNKFTLIVCFLLSTAQAEIESITPGYDEKTGMLIDEVILRDEIGNLYPFIVPMDIIGSDWEFEMYQFSIRNANWAGFSDWSLAVNCTHKGGSFVEWKIQVGNYLDTKKDTNVAWYAPQFDSTRSFDVDPSYCKEKPGTGGMWDCYFHFPQNNKNMGFNFASYHHEGATTTVTKCWRRDYELEM